MSDKKILGYVITMFNERVGIDIECRGATKDDAMAMVRDIAANGRWDETGDGDTWYYSPTAIVSLKIRAVTEEDAWGKGYSG